ncbi:MAG: T9SS type A sorting domain-containing protein, partial [Bacteroidia bacterium]
GDVEPKMDNVQGAVDNIVSGLIEDCSGNITPFRTGGESANPTANDAQVYPTHVSDASFATVAFDALESGFYTLSVYDLTGKRVYEQTSSLNEGKQRIKVSAAVFATGINIVRLVDTNGKTILASRVVKD